MFVTSVLITRGHSPMVAGLWKSDMIWFVKLRQLDMKTLQQQFDWLSSPIYCWAQRVNLLDTPRKRVPHCMCTSVKMLNGDSLAMHTNWWQAQWPALLWDLSFPRACWSCSFWTHAGSGCYLGYQVGALQLCPKSFFSINFCSMLAVTACFF